MSNWWEAAASLSPVHAWDGVDYLSGDVPDKVGGNNLGGNGNRARAIRSGLFGISGLNNTPFGLSSGISPAANCVFLFFAYYSLDAHSGTGVLGFCQNDSNYLMQHTSNNGVYGKNQLVINCNRSAAALSTVMATSPDAAARFVAVVVNSGKPRAYVDGGWAGAELAASYLPSSFGLIGAPAGLAHSLNSDESMIAAGYWTGSPSLLDLQGLETACRAAVVAPPFNFGIFGDTHLNAPLHPFWNRPQTGYDFYARCVGSQPVIPPGTAFVKGTVFKKGEPNAPVSRRVRCYDEATGVLLGEGWSDADTGFYRFDSLNPAREVFVCSFDNEDHYRAVIADKLLPQLEV